MCVMIEQLLTVTAQAVRHGAAGGSEGRSSIRSRRTHDDALDLKASREILIARAALRRPGLRW